MRNMQFLVFTLFFYSISSRIVLACTPARKPFQAGPDPSIAAPYYPSPPILPPPAPMLPSNPPMPPMPDPNPPVPPMLPPNPSMPPMFPSNPPMPPMPPLMARPVPLPPVQQPPVGPVRGCYFDSRAVLRQSVGRFTPDNYLPGLCTHIYYAYVGMSPDYRLQFTPTDIDTISRLAVLRTQQPNLKLLLSLGGWKFSDEAGLKQLMKTVSSSPQIRLTFVQGLPQLLRQIQFDGIDIDWEFPDSEDKENFAILLREIRQTFEQESQQRQFPRLLITAAVSADPIRIQQSYDVLQMGQWLDYVNLMTYDFHGSWETVTGFNSPLFDRGNEHESIASATAMWLQQGVPKFKLIIGLATYGRGFTLSQRGIGGIGAPAVGSSPPLDFTQESGLASYYEICQLISKGVLHEFYDPTQQAAFAANDQIWIGHDNPRSVVAKLDWIKRNGFSGVFVYSLDLDDFNGICPVNYGQRFPLVNVVKAQLP